VSGFRGDIKTSTYFLHIARSYPLANDFYVIRLYDPVAHEWLDVVMLKPHMWQELDGDTQVCELSHAAELLPGPLQIAARDTVLVVITYADWKQRVLQLQAEEPANA
jgi:hypothetical protein